MGIKLLLADDSITIQKVVGIIFASEDYDVTIVDNGDAALATAREIKPDVLLLDAVMPGKNGYEVCEFVRRDPILRTLPILLLTGAFEAFDEDKATKCGVDDFISKPFESQNLIEKVTALVEQGKQRRTAAPSAGPTATPPTSTPPLGMEEPSSTPEDAFSSIQSVPPPQPASGGKESTTAQFTVEVIEGSPDDDLWGAFELEEMFDDQSGHVAIASAEEEEPFVTEVIEESFSFVEEPGTIVQPVDVAQEWSPVGENSALEGETEAFEIIPEEEFALSPDIGTVALETGSELFGVFAEETEQSPLSVGPTEDFHILDEEPSNLFEIDPEESALFAEPAELPAASPQFITPAASAGEDVDLQFAPDEQYVPIAGTAATDGLPSTATTPPSAFSGELTLSEEQLSALVSRISRDILERIAWEVVPDLAETIIRDEIRKIKEGR